MEQNETKQNKKLVGGRSQGTLPPQSFIISFFHLSKQKQMKIRQKCGDKISTFPTHNNKIRTKSCLLDIPKI